jgi:iron complex outermembrane receptor protein
MKRTLRRWEPGRRTPFGVDLDTKVGMERRHSTGNMQRMQVACHGFFFRMAACVAIGGWCAEARAQQPLETITVNSERVTGFRARITQVGTFRDMEILDVPLTVNVVPRTVLDVQEAQGLFDALKNTAGVTRAQTNGTLADNLAIRGVAAENRTNYRLNGGLPVNNLIEMPMENKERVEVLKGSSALYYGFTTPSGVVNMVTKRARPEPITTVAAYGNEHGQLNGHLDVGRTLGDRGELGVRVNVAGGRVRNAIEGFDGDRQLVSAAVDWRATQSLALKLDTEDIRRSGIEQAVVGLNPAVGNVITLPHVPDPANLISGKWAWMSGNAVNFQGRADYSLGPDWAVMVEAGRAETNRVRRENSQMLNYDVGTGEGTLRVSLARGQGYINESGRTEIAGHVATGPLDHEVVSGFMKNRRYQNNPSQQVVNLRQNLYEPRVLEEPLLSSSTTLAPQTIVDKGVYVFDRVRIGAQWQVQAGARRTDYDSRSVAAAYAVKNTTPVYALLWQPRKDSTIYASYIEGLEEGGTAPLITNNGGQVLPPGLSKQREIGVRTEAIAGLLASVAYFTIERASAYTNAANFFVLDGRTEYKGFEYSAVGEVGRQVSVYLSGMFLDAEQTNAQNPAVIGKMPDNTARQAHSFFIDYRPHRLAGFGVNAGAYYTGKRFINNLEQGSIPGYTLFTAGVRYTTRLAGAPSTFQAYIENAGDKRYWSGAGGGILSVGLPRTVRMSVRVEL